MNVRFEKLFIELWYLYVVPTISQGKIPYMNGNDVYMYTNAMWNKKYLQFNNFTISEVEMRICSNFLLSDNCEKLESDGK